MRVQIHTPVLSFTDADGHKTTEVLFYYKFESDNTYHRIDEVTDMQLIYAATTIFFSLNFSDDDEVVYFHTSDRRYITSSTLTSDDKYSMKCAVHRIKLSTNNTSNVLATIRNQISAFNASQSGVIFSIR